MYQITYTDNRLGPYEAVVENEDHYLVTTEGSESIMPFGILGGKGDVEDWVGPLPQPPQPVPEVPDTRITQLAFRNRFLQSEKIMLDLASQYDPAATAQQKQQGAALRSYLADVAAASFIDLQRPDTRNGVLYLEQVGLLEDGRALSILDDPIQPDERPL